MSVVQSSSGFCLFCYKSSENPFLDHHGLLESTKKFTKALNRFTNPTEEDQNVRIVEDRLLTRFSENDKLLNYCVKCNTLLVQLCETYHQIKTLELQLDLHLNKVVGIISLANKVPSRWVHITKALEEHFQDETDNIEASKKVIRDFRHNVVKAGKYRKLTSMPRVSLKLKDNTSDDTFELNERKKTKRKDNFSGDIRTYSKPGTGTVCTKCSMHFKTKKRLYIHMRYHNDQEEPTWECSECGEKFATNWKLRVHKKAHTGGKSFKCSFCGQSFDYLHSLKRHFTSHHGNKEGVETNLNRQTKMEKAKKHILEDELVVSTTFPGHSNDNTEDKDNHLSSSEDNFEESMPIDEDVDMERIEEVERNTAFVQVKIEHTADVEDNDGDQCLTENFNMTGFHSSAENETEDNITVCCEFCKRSFPGMDQLTKHVIEDKCSPNITEKGTPQNPTFFGDNTCPKCGKQSKTNFAYKIHLEWHKNPSEWKFKCEVCGKKFYSKNNLNQHSKRHDKNLNNRFEIPHPKERSTCTLTSENDAIIIKEEPTILFSNFEESDMMDNDDNCDTENWWENASTVSSSLQITDTKGPAFIEERKRRPPPLSRQSTPDLSKSVYECEICPRKFKHVLQKERHFKFSHQLEGKPETTDTFKCDIGNCTAYFLKYLQLRKHCNDDHQSSLPKDKFLEAPKNISPGPSSTKSTIASGTPPPLYECEICTRKFKIFGLKLYHFKACHDLEGNSEAEVFKCEMEDCTGYFLKKSQLTKHYDAEHPGSAQPEPKHQSNKEFKCKKCGMIFIGWWKFSKHTLKFRFKSCAIFECKFCEEKFPYLIGLNKHLSLRHKNEMKCRETAKGI